jgi:hypothetical protein
VGLLVDGANVPGWQTAQTLLPAGAALPAAHDAQVVAPVVALNVPAAQGAHAAEPAAAAKVPT